jgi:hypothetical protein
MPPKSNPKTRSSSQAEQAQNSNATSELAAIIKDRKDSSIGEVTKGLGLMLGIANENHNEIKDMLSTFMTECRASSQTIKELKEATDSNSYEIADLQADQKVDGRLVRQTFLQLYYTQMEQIRSNVLLTNLPYHTATKDDEPEPRELTTEIVHQLLVHCKIDKQITVISAKRFKTRPGSKGPGMVQVVLSAQHEKGILFRTLVNPKLDLPFKKLSVSAEFPPMLKEQLKEARALNYEIRTKEKDTQVKIIPRDGAIVVQTRKKGTENPFADYKIFVNPDFALTGDTTRNLE